MLILLHYIASFISKSVNETLNKNINIEESKAIDSIPGEPDFDDLPDGIDLDKLKKINETFASLNNSNHNNTSIKNDSFVDDLLINNETIKQVTNETEKLIDKSKEKNPKITQTQKRRFL